MTDLLRRIGVTLAPWIGLAAAFALAPLVFPSSTSLTMMSVMGVMIIFALSYNMLLGQTGLLSFGHAVYYGLGGFVTLHAMNAISAARLPVPVPALPLIGGVAGLLFGALFGMVSVRRAGIVFAMISLGIGEMVSSSSFILRSFFGGEEGVTTNRTRIPAFLGHKFGPAIEVYDLIAVWCLVCVVAMYALTRTPFGRMCNAVRENPERVEFIGYSPQRIRFIAFCFSAFFAGVAGALSAITFEIMNASSLGAFQSGLVLLMTYVGGIGHFLGPIIGAVLISFLQTTLSDLTGAWQLYFGLLFILVVLFSPDGIAGLVVLHAEAARRGELVRLLPSYGLVAIPIAAGVAGAILVIELAHRLLVTMQSDGPVMSWFGVSLDATSVFPWLGALLLMGAGIVSGRAAWPRVEEAWAQIHLKRQHTKAST